LQTPMHPQANKKAGVYTTPAWQKQVLL